MNNIEEIEDNIEETEDNIEETEAPPEERASIVENLGQPPEKENPTTERIIQLQSDIIYCLMSYTLNQSIFFSFYISHKNQIYSREYLYLSFTRVFSCMSDAE